MLKITVEGNVPSKKNSYKIHLNPKTGARWIAPSEEVKQFEENLAWVARAAYRGDEPMYGNLQLFISAYVSNPRRDIDNLLGSILDGIERSGVIENDNQFYRIVMDKKRALEDKLEIIIKRMYVK